jgi:hypothetical protein
LIHPRVLAFEELLKVTEPENPFGRVFSRTGTIPNLTTLAVVERDHIYLGVS